MRGAFVADASIAIGWGLGSTPKVSRTNSARAERLPATRTVSITTVPGVGAGGSSTVQPATSKNQRSGRSEEEGISFSCLLDWVPSGNFDNRFFGRCNRVKIFRLCCDRSTTQAAEGGTVSRSHGSRVLAVGLRIWKRMRPCVTALVS